MLEAIWFVLWGLLWAIYFMLDGFDLGVGSLLPFVAKTETDRRLVYRSVGPFWDGNEVWLITAGGVTFAAFPATYAVMFSSLYTPLMLILFALILRGAALELRGKTSALFGRTVWDVCFVFGSFLPALLFGVAFANIFKGIPIDGEGILQGNLLILLNLYAILGGLLFLCLFLVHGSLWLAAKTEGHPQERAQKIAGRLWPAALAIAVIFLIMTAFETRLYDNYLFYPPLLVIPLLAVAAIIAARIFLAKTAYWKAWFASSITIAGTTLFGIVGLYPNLFPSSLHDKYSMTISNSASSPLALKIMLVVAVIFVPTVIVYQIWAFNLFKGRVNHKDMDEEEAY